MIEDKTMTAAIDLTGKVAIVTGGGRGIGKAITRKLAEAGANVVIASRKTSNLQATANELASLPGKVVPITCHIGRLNEVEHLVRTAEEQLGEINILVNNGGTNIAQGPALEATDEMLDKMMDINVKSALRLVRLIVPKMIDRNSGSIINIASIAGFRPQPGGLLYGLTKAGLIMMTRVWAQEFSPHGIRVNAIAPGLIQTDFSEYYWKDETLRQRIEATQPIRRIGQPDDIGYAAAYLASEQASFMTGQVMVIDGGKTLGSYE
jgi:dehydrogenase/reductase SDR family protein 4